MKTFVLCVLILFASLIYYVVMVRRRTNNEHLAVPGSIGWPIIGETLEYHRTLKRGVPEKFVADRRNRYSSSSDHPCKVFKTSLLGQSFVMLCTAAGNKFLFSNENKLVKSWWPASFLKVFPKEETSNANNEVESDVRKVISPFLKPDALRKYIGIMDQVTRRHFDDYWSPEQQGVIINAHSLVQKHTFTLSCRLFLNIQDPKQIAKLGEPMRHLTAGLISMPIDLPGTKFNRSIKASKQIKKEIINIVVQRKKELINLSNDDPAAAELAHGQDLLLSSLLRETFNKGVEMTESFIADKLFIAFVGSYDTIAITLCSFIMFLSHLPHVYDAVLKEQMEIADSKIMGELLNMRDLQKMKYTWNVVCEVMRLQPPSHGTFREAITDFEYEGYIIPKGTKIHWSVFATHKNPLYFQHPDIFDPSRFEGEGPLPFSFVPFGGGPRMCPGQDYSRVTILVFVHNLVTRFKWDKVFPNEKMVMDPLPRPTKGLPIRLYPHTHNIKKINNVRSCYYSTT